MLCTKDNYFKLHGSDGVSATENIEKDCSPDNLTSAAYLKGEKIQ
jgi:hypothetical protein